MSTRPPVGPTTVISSTATRIPSSRSSWSTARDLKSAGVSTIGFGSALPLDSTRSESAPAGIEISVIDNVFGSARGRNSSTLPVTVTKSPTAASAGGSLLLPVKTNIPSEVFGSASALSSGVCRKNPVRYRAVTIPVARTVCPSSADSFLLPCISAMETSRWAYAAADRITKARREATYFPGPLSFITYPAFAP
jgi:hypothetical protein